MSLLKYHTALCTSSSRSRNRSLLRCSSSKTLPHRSSLPVGTAGNTLRESPNEENQPQQRDHHSIERERSSSCPNIEAERQPILGKITNWDNWIGIVGTARNTLRESPNIEAERQPILVKVTNWDPRRSG